MLVALFLPFTYLLVIPSSLSTHFHVLSSSEHAPSFLYPASPSAPNTTHCQCLIIECISYHNLCFPFFPPSQHQIWVKFYDDYSHTHTHTLTITHTHTCTQSHTHTHTEVYLLPISYTRQSFFSEFRDFVSSPDSQQSHGTGDRNPDMARPMLDAGHHPLLFTLCSRIPSGHTVTLSDNRYSYIEQAAHL